MVINARMDLRVQHLGRKKRKVFSKKIMEIDNTKNQGWIKLYRKSLDSQIWQNPHLWQLWCYCLLRANHKTAWVSVKTGKGETQVRLQPGQFIFGRFEAAKTLKATPSGTYKRLQKLKKAENLTTQNCVHYTLVTVNNWESYQSGNTQVTPKEHPSNTDKNDKNDKNKYCPNSIELDLSQFLWDLILERKPDHKKPDLQKWAVHIDQMIRIDKRDPDRIRDVIRWCQADDFWQDNILSTNKLRQHFDKLELAMQKKKGKYGSSKTRQHTETVEPYIR